MDGAKHGADRLALVALITTSEWRAGGSAAHFYAQFPTFHAEVVDHLPAAQAWLREQPANLTTPLQ